MWFQCAIQSQFFKLPFLPVVRDFPILFRNKVESDNPFDMNRDVSLIERIYFSQLSCECDSKHANHIRNGQNINSSNSVRRKYCVFFSGWHTGTGVAEFTIFFRVGFFFCCCWLRAGNMAAANPRQDKSTELCTQALRVNNVKWHRAISHRGIFCGFSCSQLVAMAGREFSRTEHLDFFPFEMCINLLSGCLLFQVSQTVDSITHRLKIIDNQFLFAGLYRERPKKTHTHTRNQSTSHRSGRFIAGIGSSVFSDGFII